METFPMRFTARSVIRTTPEKLFAFHELPDVFTRLMPPWEKSRVVEPVSSLRVGSRAIVDARIVPGIFIRWESEHTAYDPPHAFEDQQVRGPFRSWRHRHVVEPHPEGALLIDDIEYTLPFGILGRLFAGVLIERRLRRVFAFRHRVTREYCENVAP
jgi:ligand-binding SRPBCC domain-containing protein